MEETSKIKRQLPKKHEVEAVLSTFSPLERLGFIICVGIAIITLFIVLFRINNNFLVSVPTEGGTLSEGIVGTPRFINPLLSVTDADRDITKLVYRGLMKKDEEGAIVPDIADSYTVSSDGLTYTFVMKDAYFADGQKITADDVFFTVKSAQDATLKSVERVAWTGVLARVVDEKTISFTLKQSYAPFIESTTLGILPKHIWEEIPYESWTYSEYNTEKGVGSGMYRVKNISTNSSGIPAEYELVAVRKKGNPAPRIDTIVMHFYPTESALVSAYSNGTIDAAGGIDPESAEILKARGAHIMTVALPRVFGLFFNENTTKIFTESAVRKAVRVAIDQDKIVSEVLKGYGRVVDGPIPPRGEGEVISALAALPTDIEQRLSDSKFVLEKAGWKLGSDGIYTKALSKKETVRLSFEIATNDVPELKAAVDMIAEDLRKAGIEAIPKVYETGSLNQDIIRPRKFQALFFGEVIGNQSDLYAFWHSSQRSDPGLNISSYANPRTDKLLESALSTLDTKKRDDIYFSFEKEIAADAPAAFVYSPTYIYAIRPSLAGITIGEINRPEDRFNMIKDWYLATERVWKVFAKN